jgi:alpha-L-rhamnosidase
LGTLQYVDALVPHPKGNIVVQLKRKGQKGIEGNISLPGNLTGEFVWMGQVMLLKSGNQRVHF